MKKTRAAEILKKLWGSDFDSESAEWKLADNIEQAGNILRYTVNADSVTGYTVEVSLTGGAKRHCGTGAGCSWTEWEGGVEYGNNNNSRPYYVEDLYGRHFEDSRTIGKFDSLDEAIAIAQSEWCSLSTADRKTSKIEVRQYSEDIEVDDCNCFDYNDFEWQVVIPELSEREIEAVKKLYTELPFEVTSSADDYEHGYLTINHTKEGREFVWYMEGDRSEAVYVDSLEWLDEEDINMREKIKELFEIAIKEPGKYYISTEKRGSETNNSDEDMFTIGGEEGWEKDDLEELQNYVELLMQDAEDQGRDLEIDQWHLYPTYKEVIKE